MTREIKFRAWDKGSDGMTLGNGLRLSAENPKMIYADNEGWSWFSDVCFNNDRYIVMQYTGLKDRNGVEIYEGDWLKVEYPGGDIVHQEASMEMLGERLYHPHLEFEILGNIYEHPNLIT